MNASRHDASATGTVGGEESAVRHDGDVDRKQSPSKRPLPYDEAVRRVQDLIPFRKIMKPGRVVGDYWTVAAAVQRHLKPPAKILDFGAGQCVKPAILSMMGYDCYACDDLNDPWHLKDDNRAKIERFAADSGVHFARLDQSTPWPYRAEEFDMVMLHHVLEHLHDSPRELMIALMELVRPGGLLFVMVPNAGNLRKRIALMLGKTNLPSYDYFYWQRGPWRGHVREYVRDDLAQLAKYLDLEIVELRGCHNLIGCRDKATRVIWRIICAPNANWRDSWLLVARKPPRWSPMRELPAEDPLWASLERDVG